MSDRLTVGLGIGNCAVGLAGDPSSTRKRPDLCAEYGHPGVTYNPWMNRTWCLCGDVTRDGDQATHADCCGGPLIESANRETTDLQHAAAV